MEAWLAGQRADETHLSRAVPFVAGLNRPQPAGAARQDRAAGDLLSTDILYDTLRKYDPGPHHARDHAGGGDARAGRFRPDRRDARPHRRRGSTTRARSRVSPLAAPLFLEPGRVRSRGLIIADQRLLEDERRAAHDSGGSGRIRHGWSPGPASAPDTGRARMRVLGSRPSHRHNEQIHERPFSFGLSRRKTLPPLAVRRALVARAGRSLVVSRKPAPGKIRPHATRKGRPLMLPPLRGRRGKRSTRLAVDSCNGLMACGVVCLGDSSTDMAASRPEMARGHWSTGLLGA